MLQRLSIATGLTSTSTGAITLANLLNKTLLGRNTAGTGSPEGVTLTQVLDWIGTTARGDILFRGATSWARLPAGTAGQFLQTNGTTGDPVWAPGGAGGGVAPFIGTPFFRPNGGTAFGNGNFGCRAIFFAEACNIVSVASWCVTAQPTGKLIPGVYDADPTTGIIRNLLATGPQVTGVTAGLNIVPLTAPVAVTAGTTLWVGCQLTVINTSFATVGALETAFFASAAALPTPAPAATYGTGSSMCFWAKTVV